MPLLTYVHPDVGLKFEWDGGSVWVSPGEAGPPIDTWFDPRLVREEGAPPFTDEGLVEAARWWIEHNRNEL